MTTRYVIKCVVDDPVYIKELLIKQMKLPNVIADLIAKYFYEPKFFITKSVNGNVLSGDWYYYRYPEIYRFTPFKLKSFFKKKLIPFIKI